MPHSLKYRYSITPPVVVWAAPGSGITTTYIRRASWESARIPNRTREKINSFSALPNGWHYGSGRAPSARSIDKALAWHGLLTQLGFTATDAFPGEQGEIMITAYEGPHYIEILLDTDASISLIYEKSNEEKKRLERKTTEQVMMEVVSIAGDIWNTPGYSIQPISTVNVTSSRAWHSRSTTTAHPLSNLRVLPGAASANISEHFIPTWAVSPQYFGSLTNQSYPLVPA